MIFRTNKKSRGSGFRFVLQTSVVIACFWFSNVLVVFEYMPEFPPLFLICLFYYNYTCVSRSNHFLAYSVVLINFAVKMGEYHLHIGRF